MDLSFATDSKRYSAAVESLRQEGKELSQENIKDRYDALGGKTKPAKEDKKDGSETENKKDTPQAPKTKKPAKK